MSLAFLIFIFYQASSAQAMTTGQGGSRPTFKATKISLVQQTYSGSKNKSLSEGSAGYGVEFSLDNGGVYFRYNVKARYISSTGRQTFLDASTQTQSAYKFSQAQVGLGLQFFPISRVAKGINIYLQGGGFASYDLLELSGTGFTNLKSREQVIGGGYEAGIGLEFVFITGKGSTWMIQGELGSRNEKTVIANQNDFDLSHLYISAGLGF